nr:alpha/beta hydrolase fold domain-containing protein [Arthrobacter sp. ISL-85]
MSPVFADVRYLPPVLIVIGEQDILLEDNLAVASRLAVAGNEVDLRVYPASPHAFTGHATPMARSALSSIDEWLWARLTPTG